MNKTPSVIDLTEAFYSLLFDTVEKYRFGPVTHTRLNELRRLNDELRTAEFFDLRIIPGVPPDLDRVKRVGKRFLNRDVQIARCMVFPEPIKIAKPPADRSAKYAVKFPRHLPDADLPPEKLAQRQWRKAQYAAYKRRKEAELKAA
jgi:hypothetical protein